MTENESIETIEELQSYINDLEKACADIKQACNEERAKIKEACAELKKIRDETHVALTKACDEFKSELKPLITKICYLCFFIGVFAILFVVLIAIILKY